MKNHTSAAAASISDPGNPLEYMTMGTDFSEDASSTNNVLVIKVPADHSELFLGAGLVSGFRMHTDHHADLIAAGTKLSLGDKQAVGLEDGFSLETDKNWKTQITGFSDVFVNGKKKEQVNEDANHIYGSTLEFRSKTRTDEVVEGNWTQKTSEHFENQSKDRHEKIDEEWKADIGKLEWKVTQTAEIHSASDWHWHVGGEKHEFTVGATQEVLFGSETKVILLNKNEAIVGAVTDLMAGGKLEITLMKKGEINLGPKSEMDIMKEEVKTLKSETSGLETITAGLVKKTCPTELKQLGVDLNSSEARIMSAAMCIMK